MENNNFFNIPDIKIAEIYWCYQENITTPWKYKSRLDPWMKEDLEHPYKYRLRWHLSGVHEFISADKRYIASGRYALVLENHTIDDFFDFFRQSVELPNRYISIAFSTEEPIDKSFFTDNTMRVFPADRERLTEIFTNALRLFPSKPNGWQLEIRSILYEGLLALFKTYMNMDFKIYPKSMADTINYIDKHLYDDKLTIKELSENLHISNVHFSRLFSQTFGISPKKYILDKKLENVASALIYTSTSIQLLCEEMGFNDTSYFNRLFKRKYGVPPRVYRMKHKV